MKKIFSLLSSLAILLMMASCDEKATFSPGPEASVNGTGVFFYSYDAQNIVDAESDSLDIWLMRTDNSTSLDVPVIIEKTTDNLHFAENVHFEKGDTAAVLWLTYDNVLEGDEHTFSLRIPDEYANPYAEKEGSTRMESSIFRAKWENVCDTLIFGPADRAYPDQGCYLQRLPGRNRFRFTDFLGSGQPLEFSLKTGYDKDNVYLSKGQVVPLTNVYEDGDYWYFTNGGDYDPWTPAGSDKLISYSMFYNYDTYCFLDLNYDPSTAEELTFGGQNYLCDYSAHYCMLTSWMVYAEGTAGWQYIYLYLGYKPGNEPKQ